MTQFSDGDRLAVQLPTLTVAPAPDSSEYTGIAQQLFTTLTWTRLSRIFTEFYVSDFSDIRIETVLHIFQQTILKVSPRLIGQPSSFNMLGVQLYLVVMSNFSDGTPPWKQLIVQFGPHVIDLIDNAVPVNAVGYAEAYRRDLLDDDGMNKVRVLSDDMMLLLVQHLSRLQV